MSKAKKPTPAQQKLISAIQWEGVERRKYESHHPGYITLTWHWVGCKSERSFTQRTISACQDKGWVKSIRGKLKPGTPVGLDALALAMGDWRMPDRLSLTDVHP